MRFAVRRRRAGCRTWLEAAVRAHGGRVVKLLGDGVMFRFADLGTATSALLELVETVPASGLGPAHLGMERGLVIERDGDVFGRTVNLAARIAGAAAPGEVLAGPDAAAGLGADARFALEPAGIRELRESPRRQRSTGCGEPAGSARRRATSWRQVRPTGRASPQRGGSSHRRHGSRSRSSAGVKTHTRRTASRTRIECRSWLGAYAAPDRCGDGAGVPLLISARPRSRSTPPGGACTRAASRGRPRRSSRTVEKPRPSARTKWRRARQPSPRTSFGPSVIPSRVRTIIGFLIGCGRSKRSPADVRHG